MIEAAYEGWAADETAGLASILIAPDNDTVAVLNRRAQDGPCQQGAWWTPGAPCGWPTDSPPGAGM